MIDQDKELLGSLLQVRTQSFKEDLMVQFLLDYAEARGWGRERDGHNNVILTKGDAAHFPMVASHLDTVQPVSRPIHLRWEGDVVYGVDDRGVRIGCGADCKTGIFVCLKLMETTNNLKCGFFAAEEVGAVGASKLDPRHMRDVGYVLEFDCPSARILSYTSGGVRLFQNNGPFINRILPVLEGLRVRWQRHPYTDVKVLAGRFDISCLNLASGYHNWHSHDEYVALDDVDDAVLVGRALLDRLGAQHYPRPAALLESDGGPQHKVTGLVVP